jgi:Predicted membrane protein (DUF2142)
MGETRKLILLILAAVFLAGVGVSLITPPFEGADETAHWSYLQELADRRHPLVLGRDSLSADLQRYRGPRPYADAPPFEANGGETYRSFHQHGGALDGARPGAFADSQTANWEAQHPPLYYVALLPAFQLARGLDFKHGLEVLRLVSWLIAFAGLAGGVLATAVFGGERLAKLTPLVALWPFAAPQFLPSLARLGNDSLCLLEAAIAWTMLLLLNQRLRQPAVWLVAGLALGLGLLTKALFLPIVVGYAAFLVFLGWRKGELREGLIAAAAIGVVALIVGGWWYLAQYQATGDLTGGQDFVQLKAQGGLMAGLAHNASPVALLRGIAAFVATFAWTGTWSLARPPELFILGPVLLVGLGLWNWGRSLREAEPAETVMDWAPAFLTAPLVLSLLYHVLAFVALTGRGASTPGYYLHVLAAPLGLAFALGWRGGLMQRLLFGYTAGFTLAVWALQLSLFSGCAAKLGADPHYSFTGAACFLDGRQLAVLGEPVPALLCALAALGLLLYAAILAQPWRAGDRDEPDLIPLI